MRASRIRSPYMRSQWTLDAIGIFVIEELIRGRVRFGHANTIDRSAFRKQRIAIYSPPNQARGEIIGGFVIRGLLLHKLPEAAHILIQVPHDQVSSITAGIFFCHIVFRRG